MDFLMMESYDADAVVEAIVSKPVDDSALDDSKLYGNDIWPRVLVSVTSSLKVLDGKEDFNPTVKCQELEEPKACPGDGTPGEATQQHKQHQDEGTQQLGQCQEVVQGSNYHQKIDSSNSAQQELCNQLLQDAAAQKTANEEDIALLRLLEAGSDYEHPGAALRCSALQEDNDMQIFLNLDDHDGLFGEPSGGAAASNVWEPAEQPSRPQHTTQFRDPPFAAGDLPSRQQVSTQQCGGAVQPCFSNLPATEQNSNPFSGAGHCQLGTFERMAMPPAPVLQSTHQLQAATYDQAQLANQSPTQIERLVADNQQLEQSLCGAAKVAATCNTKLDPRGPLTMPQHKDGTISAVAKVALSSHVTATDTPAQIPSSSYQRPNSRSLPSSPGETRQFQPYFSCFANAPENVGSATTSPGSPSKSLGASGALAPTASGPGPSCSYDSAPELQPATGTQFSWGPQKCSPCKPQHHALRSAASAGEPILTMGPSSNAGPYVPPGRYPQPYPHPSSMYPHPHRLSRSQLPGDALHTTGPSASDVRTCNSHGARGSRTEVSETDTSDHAHEGAESQSRERPSVMAASFMTGYPTMAHPPTGYPMAQPGYHPGYPPPYRRMVPHHKVPRVAHQPLLRHPHLPPGHVSHVRLAVPMASGRQFANKRPAAVIDPNNPEEAWVAAQKCHKMWSDDKFALPMPKFMIQLLSQDLDRLAYLTQKRLKAKALAAQMEAQPNGQLQRKEPAVLNLAGTANAPGRMQPSQQGPLSPGRTNSGHTMLPVSTSGRSTQAGTFAQHPSGTSTYPPPMHLPTGTQHAGWASQAGMPPPSSHSMPGSDHCPVQHLYPGEQQMRTLPHQRPLPMTKSELQPVAGHDAPEDGFLDSLLNDPSIPMPAHNTCVNSTHPGSPALCQSPRHPTGYHTNAPSSRPGTPNKMSRPANVVVAGSALEAADSRTGTPTSGKRSRGVASPQEAPQGHGPFVAARHDTSHSSPRAMPYANMMHASAPAEARRVSPEDPMQVHSRLGWAPAQGMPGLSRAAANQPHQFQHAPGMGHIQARAGLQAFTAASLRPAASPFAVHHETGGQQVEHPQQ